MENPTIFVSLQESASWKTLHLHFETSLPFQNPTIFEVADPFSSLHPMVLSSLSHHIHRKPYSNPSLNLQEPSSAPGLEDCLKLLKGERDEQRLAGLLLATKFCQANDTESVLKVYEAIGTRFLDRLLMTGNSKMPPFEVSSYYVMHFLYHFISMLCAGAPFIEGTGKGRVGNKEGEDREAYLQLSVTVLAAFCRVPEIAGSKDMVKKVPAVLEIISNRLGSFW